MDGTGESSANPYLANIQIIGSNAGLGGVFATTFNAMQTDNLKVNGYTTGQALYHRGVNGVTHLAPILEACANGVFNTAILDGAMLFSANAIHLFGGAIVGMSGYGWVENREAGASNNLSNVANGVVFENNGLNASTTTGHIFAQNTVGLYISGCYFEDYAGIVPVSAVTIGDALNTPESITITGCMFATSGTNVINNINGQNVNVNSNICVGAVTNFYNQGTGARGAVVRANRASAAANYFAGLDSGFDTNIDAGTLQNSNGTSSFGYSFNSISGLAQDLEVRTRSGGANVMVFVNAAGTSVGAISDSGFVAGTGFSVGGDQVVGARNTGWSAMSGTATKGGFNTATVTTAQLAQVVKALTDALTTSGAIGA